MEGVWYEDVKVTGDGEFSLRWEGDNTRADSGFVQLVGKVAVGSIAIG